MDSNLVKFINSINFLHKKYFFIFIYNTTKITEIYIGTKKAIS